MQSWNFLYVLYTKLFSFLYNPKEKDLKSLRKQQKASLLAFQTDQMQMQTMTV
jgi:hypothetical protein